MLGAYIRTILWLVPRFEHVPLVRLLNWPPIAMVGVLFYSLYLWQQIFPTPHGDWWDCDFRQNLVFAFVAAILSYYFVESPMNWLKDRLGKSPVREVETQLVRGKVTLMPTASCLKWNVIHWLRSSFCLWLYMNKSELLLEFLQP